MPLAVLRLLTRQKLSVDFVTLQHACPKGIYVTPVADEPLLWRGVIFVRKGPYANAVLRFQIAFPDDFPARPPVVSFLSDVFHPLIAPLTTYTYTARDRATEGVSAADEERLPPGGLILRHGFPEWYDHAHAVSEDGDVFSVAEPKPAVVVVVNDVDTAADDATTGTTATDRASTGMQLPAPSPDARPPPHIIEVLQYMRIILDTEVVIESVPLELAANPGAWHAWRSHRAKLLEPRQTSAVESRISRDRSMSPNKPQPGGARRPGEWNWAGVWEDRVKKAVQTSISEATLYGSDGNSDIEFSKLSDDMYNTVPPIAAAHATPLA